MARNVELNYKKLVEDIRLQIERLKTKILINDSFDSASPRYNPYYGEISPLVSKLNFYVADEQEFLKSQEKLDSNGVYVAVKFGKASTNFGSSICAITLMVMGTANRVAPVQMFFSAFATEYSTKGFPFIYEFGSEENGYPITNVITDNNSSQLWVTPGVVGNFNEVGTSFRNLFDVSGTLVIGQSVVKVGSIQYKYGSGSADIETIDFMAFQDNYRNNLNPQPFGNTLGFAKSETNFSSQTFTISTYLLNNHLIADCLAIKGYRYRVSSYDSSKTSHKQATDPFEMIIKFTNGYTNNPIAGESDNSDEVIGKDFFKTYRLVSCEISQKIGDIPSFVATFTY